MSDEPTPPTPPLRLKPRLRPAEGEPTAALTPAAENVVPAPVVAPALAPVSPPEPVPPAEPPAPAPAAPEAQRFRLKPKLAVVAEPAVSEVPLAPAAVAPTLFITDPAPPAAPPAADVPVVELPSPPTSPGTAAELVPPTVWAPKQGLYVAGDPVKKPLPPFPTIAVDGKDRKARSTLPHLSSGDDGAELDPALALPAESGRRRPPSLLIALAIVAVAATGFFGWRYLQGRGVAKPAPAPAKAAPAAAAPTKAPAPAKPAPLTPSESLNQLAQVPVNAINKAQDAIAARRAGEQSRVDAVVTGGDVPNRAAPKVMAPKAPPTMTNVAPGLAASAPIDADSDSSRAFRLFVANARISGVFQGNPPRAMINGKITRAGDRVDADLGIVFEGLSPDRRQLVFTDRSGAKVFRGY